MVPERVLREICRRRLRAERCTTCSPKSLRTIAHRVFHEYLDRTPTNAEYEGVRDRLWRKSIELELSGPSSHESGPSFGSGSPFYQRSEVSPFQENAIRDLEDGACTGEWS